MMFCTECGKKLNDSALFCTNCGAVQTFAESPFTADEPAKPEPLQVDTDGYAVINVTPSDEVKKTEPPKNEGRKTAILSVIFGLFIFVFVLAGTVLASFGGTLRDGKLSAAIAARNPAKLEIGGLLQREDLSATLAHFGADVYGISEDITLAEFVALYSGLENLNSEDVARILEHSGIMDYAGEIVRSYELYILDGEVENVVTSARILRLLKENEAIIYNSAGGGVRINYEVAQEQLSQYESDIISANPSHTLENIGGITSAVLSIPVVFGAFFLALAFTALIVLTTRRIPAALLTAGICTLFSGALILCTCLASPLILSAAGLPYKQLRGFAERLLESSFTGSLSVSAWVLIIVGVVFIGGSVALRIFGIFPVKKEMQND